MKAITRPFPAKQHGLCPIGGVHPIKKGDLIVKLEKPIPWTKEHRTRRGRPYLTKRSTRYVHAKCLKERNNDERKDSTV